MEEYLRGARGGGCRGARAHGGAEGGIRGQERMGWGVRRDLGVFWQCSSWGAMGREGLGGLGRLEWEGVGEAEGWRGVGGQRCDGLVAAQEWGDGVALHCWIKC